MKSICARFALVALCLSLGVCADSVAQAQADNGSQLGITASVVSTTCSIDASAVIQVEVNVTTSGSAAPASVLTLSRGELGGATFTQQGPTITNWSHSGRNKTAELAFSETLP